MAKAEREKRRAPIAGAAFGPWPGTVFAEAMAEVGSDVLRFAVLRLQENVGTQHRLLTARHPGEVRHILAEFTQTAIDQYSAETGRIVARSVALTERLGLPRPD